MRSILLPVAFALLLATGLHGATADRVLRLADGREIGFTQMVKEASDASFIFLAENHTTPQHHAAQLDFIRELRKNGRPLAIALEMFTANSQPMLDRWVAGRLSPADFREVFARNWRMPWELYSDILNYARNNRIQLVGLNLPIEISRKVAREGFAALTPEERRLLPKGITCTVSPTYMEFIRQAYANHTMGDRELEHFCEAQVLWNRNMASRLQHFRMQNRSHTVVALVGIGHALKKGVPEELTADPERFRVVLPEFSGLNRHNLTSEDADYLLLFPAGNR
jgi:uncharacterized iron-regulated protein